MDSLAAVRRRFRHHAWAGSTLLGAIRATPAPDAVRPFAHALAADRVWQRRVEGASTEGLEIWPDLDVEACAALLRETTEGWRRALAAADLEARVAYRTSRGEPFENRLADVLEHVLLHAAHHRGQACAAVRRAGGVPPPLDLIVWARLGEPGG